MIWDHTVMVRGKGFAFQLLIDIDVGDVHLDLLKNFGLIWQASCAQIYDLFKT